MDTVSLTHKDVRSNHSKENLRGRSFRELDLRSSNFTGSDLRGADFSGANLVSASFRGARTGITPGNSILLFSGALIVSGLSGYMSMIAGHEVHQMLESDDKFMRAVGIITCANVVAFIVIGMWIGLRNAITNFVIPTCVISVLVGAVSYSSGAGSGMAALFLVGTLGVVAMMFVVGTIARAVAESLSKVMFLAVALFGSAFGHSLGGGVATLVLAIGCAVVSKRAIGGAPGFEILRKIVQQVTEKYGTSFRGATLYDADFSGARLHNADFSKARLSGAIWDRCKKRNCRE